MMLLEVAVAAPLEKTLTYSLPESFFPDRVKESDVTGRRVLVPLGRRKVTGYVFGKADTVDSGVKIRAISEILDTAPLFHPDIVDFFRWVARYYHYPVGEVVRTALPGGLVQKSARIVTLPPSNRQVFLDQFSNVLPREQEIKLLQNGELTTSESKSLLSGSGQTGIKNLLEKDILVIRDKLVRDTVNAKKEICYSLAVNIPDSFVQGDPPDRKTYRDFCEKYSVLADKALKLSEVKTLYYLQNLAKAAGAPDVPKKELVKSYSGSAGTITDLMDYGLIDCHERRVYRSPLGERLPHFPKPCKLTEGQEQALGKIIPAVSSGEFSPFLLHGITGSGKTEVYLRAAEAALRHEKDVLVIVPEISIATQLEAHFVSRFSDKVVLLHSGLSRSERFDQYNLALTGKANIVIGARSAVFAPLKNIGLIVVDEEHDSSLKQDDKLRYNGRDIALVRARNIGATVILGSATPTVVSYNNCILKKYTLLELSERVGESRLPEVSIIDLTKGTPDEKKQLFREPLRLALRTNLDAGKQSVVLLNRRGFASSMLCKECGQPVQCRNCNVSLTHHQAKGELICHYCGFKLHEKTVCAACNSTSLISVGLGTERVEEELRKLYPDARIARLDTDTAYDRKEFLKTIDDMRDGAVDILVGTQMIAKGLHFPGVTLVGVVWADGGLCIPDYRSSERTYQLITQVTGRAGRGDVPGKVYVQTMRPDHYAIQYAKTHDYNGLFRKELELRQTPLYPPYVRLVAVHVRGEDELEVSRCATQLTTALRGYAAGKNMDVEILGPGPAPIDRIKNIFRWQLLIKSSVLDQLHTACEYIRFAHNEVCTRKCRVILDVDPETMM